jgi:hypothetical protein
MIGAANERTQDTADTSALLVDLLTEEEAREARQNAAEYAKRLLADLDAARDEMHARFVNAIAADKKAD